LELLKLGFWTPLVRDSLKDHSPLKLLLLGVSGGVGWLQSREDDGTGLLVLAKYIYIFFNI
jgi:hypothetical protein